MSSSSELQMPRVTSASSSVPCEDITMDTYESGAGLRIVEQPQVHFRFRYKSEMKHGAHGCIRGRTTARSKVRTHPTVELMNYTGEALIRVKLIQPDKDEEHPHKLLQKGQEIPDISTVVPKQGSYKVGFPGMSILHTAKKTLLGLLFEKYAQQSKNKHYTDAALRTICKNTAKKFNLNIVRLKFSAHDLATDKEICPPVISDPIHNMKSAATNNPQICRYNHVLGRPRGGEELFLLVKKVEKENIQVRFYELNEHGEEVWSTYGNFIRRDIHYQYGIVVKTPPYRDTHITKNVKVHFELVRPSNGRTSRPGTFEYKAKYSKQQPRPPLCPSLSSSSGGYIQSFCEVPAMAEMMVMPVGPSTDLGEALSVSAVAGLLPLPSPLAPLSADPMLGAPNMPELPLLSLDPAEIDRILADDNLDRYDQMMHLQMDLNDYMMISNSHAGSFYDKPSTGMEWLSVSQQMISDNVEQVNVTEELVWPPSYIGAQPELVWPPSYIGALPELVWPPSYIEAPPQLVWPTSYIEAPPQLVWPPSYIGALPELVWPPSYIGAPPELVWPPSYIGAQPAEHYFAIYTQKDYAEFKKLVTKICKEIEKKRSDFNKPVVRGKLERLFQLRLSNGDTCLHRALCTDGSNLEKLLQVIEMLKMTHLLNLTNDRQQTILHLAVMIGLPNFIEYLVRKGCDPMLGDSEGNTALHVAAACGGESLRALLRALRARLPPLKLDVYNDERQVALHMAALHDCADSAELLMSLGAKISVPDAAGRTPLHLALHQGCYNAAAVIARHTQPCDIDVIDGMGSTALQIICGKNDVRQEALDIVKILLEKQADPLRHELYNESAWQLSSGAGPLRRALEEAGVRAPPPNLDNINSGPEVALDDINSGPEVALDDINSGPEVEHDYVNSGPEIALGDINSGPEEALDDINSRPVVEHDYVNSGPEIALDDINSRPEVQLDYVNSGPEVALDDINSGPEIALDDINSGPEVALDDFYTGSEVELDYVNSGPTLDDVNSGLEVALDGVNSGPEVDFGYGDDGESYDNLAVAASVEPKKND